MDKIIGMFDPPGQFTFYLNYDLKNTVCFVQTIRMTKWDRLLAIPQSQKK